MTGFFRDPKAFESLATLAVPKILEAHENGDPIRVWVAGCSSGEEAYSVAICLLEAAAERDVRIPIQVFASDVDRGAIEVARVGVYPDNIEADVSAERLRKFSLRRRREAIGSPNGCASFACSPCRIWLKTRPSRESISSPAATC